MPKRSEEELERRTQFMADAAELGVPFVADAAGYSFLVEPTDRSIGGKLFIRGKRGEFTILAAATILLEAGRAGRFSRGGDFLEIGANIGTATIPAVRTHGYARAIAFEPEPRNARLLRANAVLNGVEDRIVVVEAAVGDAPGTASLNIHAQNSGAHWIGAGRTAATTEVPVVTVDGTADDGVVDAAGVALAWLDVQGYEAKALAGAERTLLAPGVPLVLEFDPRGLERHGDLGVLHEILGEHYDRFHEMRRFDRRGQPRDEAAATPSPTSELPALSDRLLDPGEPGNFTDLLVWRD